MKHKNRQVGGFFIPKSAEVDVRN